VKSYGAGMLTVLSNRIVDVALLMVIAWIINFGSWSLRIMEAVAAIDRQMLQRVWQELVYRIDICRDEGWACRAPVR
jgi:hypothetical protein